VSLKRETHLYVSLASFCRAYSVASKFHSH
jgi:hypothetical protein